MKNTTFRVDDAVRIGNNPNIPLRYQGRTGLVVGKTRTGKGFRYQVEPVGGRRATPLVLSATSLTAL